MPTTQISKKSRFFLYLIGTISIGGFLYGVVYLLHLRYSAGDGYPPYSSYRADPLGTKALYEGIQEVPGLTAVRSYMSVTKLREQTGITLLYLGLHPGQFFWVEKEIVATFEDLLLHGNRLVLTFSPVQKAVSSENFWDDNDAEEPELDDDSEEPEEKEADEKQPSFDLSEFAVDLPEKWGIEFGYAALTLSEDDVYEPLQATRASNEALPDSLSWHTALYFQPVADKNWTTVYEAAGHPVIIERSFGSGSLILCSDSYFVSNEALQVERHADLLAWMIGPHARVVFDETHLGVMENPGIATLIRKYRLMWFVGSVIVLALLFVWKNMVSFVPPVDDAVVAPEQRAGKDSLGGLINLLRQNISSRKILMVCVDEWEKSLSHRQKKLPSVIEHVHAVTEAEASRPAREQQPVESYRKICQILAKHS